MIWSTKVTLKTTCVKGLGYWRNSQLSIHLNTQDSGKMTRRMDMASGKTKIGKGGMNQSWLSVPLLAGVKPHVLMGRLGDEGGMCSTPAIRLELLGKHYMN